MSNRAETATDGKVIPKDAEFIAARNMYIVIFATFLTVCFIAVTLTIHREATKTGFHAIEVSQPMSFFDSTYLHKGSRTPQR